MSIICVEYSHPLLIQISGKTLRIVTSGNLELFTIKTSKVNEAAL